MTAIGFVGLGSMGAPMARNLAAAGFDVRAYNRHPKEGANARTPREAAEPGLVVSMVSHDDALRAVTLGDDGVLAGLPPGGVHVAMSTVAPETARELAALHRERGVHYVAAPVFGRPDAAASRKLWIAAAGPAEAKARARPALDAMGQGVFDLGEDAAAANVVKLAGNFLLATLIEGLGEALALAERHGVDRARVVETLGQTILPAPAFLNYGRAIATHQYEPAGFRLELGLKDVRLALRTADAANVPMPLASLLHDRYLRAVAEGRGHLDWAGIGLLASEDAGLR